MLLIGESLRTRMACVRASERVPPTAPEWRARSVDCQEREITGVAKIQRAGVERFKDRRCRRKFRPLDLVRKIPGESRDFEQRAVSAFLITDAKRYHIRGQC